MTATPNDLPPRAQVLHEAAELITGDRNKSYGTPTQNFSNIADLWNVQFRHLLKDGEEFTARHVAEALILLKLARNIADPKRDNWVDLAGYAGCGYETTLPADEERAAGYSGHVRIDAGGVYIFEPGTGTMTAQEAARRAQEDLNKRHDL